MEMVKITQCDATECAYNFGQKCHAMAITVGSAIDRKCDTFCRSETKGGFPDVIGGVGACKVASCSHNQKLECSAPEIQIGYAADEIDCLTFTPQ